MNCQRTQECHICLENLSNELSASPCGHVFHQACILQALEVNSQCPICRRYATEKDVISLYLDIQSDDRDTTTTSESSSSTAATTSPRKDESQQVTKLSERVTMLVERLQWQKKQHDLLLAEMKRIRSQSEHLLMEKQSLLQRVSLLEVNKSELLGKVAKYQMELSRQAEATRQMSVNQSIINYLNSCNADALEDEVQNPRELIVALKKACMWGKNRLLCDWYNVFTVAAVPFR